MSEPKLAKLVGKATRRIHPRGTQRVLQRLFPVSGTPLTTILDLPEGAKFHIDTSSQLEWRLYFLGGIEPVVSDLIQELLTEDACALDIGANVGIHTIAMGRRARRGIVISCEPNPNVFARLKANVGLNDLSNVLCFETAVADSSDPVILHVPPDGYLNQGRSSLIPIEDWAGISVASTTVDRLLGSIDHPPVALVKIDVEGWEGPVLDGARQTLTKFQPALIIEYEPRYWDLIGYSLEQVTGRLREIGYTQFYEVGRRALHAIRAEPPTAVNLVALRSSQRLPRRFHH